ncbi:Chaperone protein YajL [uncultured Roseburia sp.]|uniref:DJ-1/PfpI family protein n=1 Tax=Brotonthovivens ammoniilytica TaxID=2981725 RepID=A0ABT2TJJ4_9FIRM|nr:DJ-1 family glyoxalase III [Brotonthovivens ammoniilytica]MCU6762378.1 DJ-1/PfpI family protein [Brotonthovivens ammoniilytica]SCI69836.1 Chaperone protein YajL [uncultured Roseburia sp.]
MKKIGILLAEGFEEVEALTAADICRRAGIITGLISITGSKTVTGAHKITVQADELFENIVFEGLDGIVLPGGMPGTENLRVYPGVKEKVRMFYDSGRLTAAICAAPGIFGEMGILKGRDAAVYPGCEAGEDVNWLDRSTVVSGHVITGRGPGAAACFALELVKFLMGEEKAEEIKDSFMMP